MSYKIEGSNCVRCKSYLFSDDDIVYCPVCGAPHHRECYNELGHCALDSLHGTEQEYSREKEIKASQKAEELERERKAQKNNSQQVRCTKCGETLEKSQRRCDKCGMPNYATFEGYAVFDFLGGVKPDYKLSDNVTAEEAKQFVVTNTHRYIPKFVYLNKKKKTSWNWAAFLFPAGWMLSRKMYKGGIILSVILLLATMLSYPLSNEIYSMGFPENITYTELLTGIMERAPQINPNIIIAAFIGSCVVLAVRVVTALFGDYFYKTYVISKITQIKQESDDLNSDLRRKGGVNVMLFFFSFLALEYLPYFLASFL